MSPFNFFIAYILVGACIVSIAVWQGYKRRDEATQIIDESLQSAELLGGKDGRKVYGVLLFVVMVLLWPVLVRPSIKFKVKQS